MNVTHGLRRALQINPNGLAIVYGDRRKSWREVGDRVARLAAGIRALGAQAGDRVACCRSIPIAISNFISRPAGPAL